MGSRSSSVETIQKDAKEIQLEHDMKVVKIPYFLFEIEMFLQVADDELRMEEMYNLKREIERELRDLEREKEEVKREYQREIDMKKLENRKEYDDEGLKAKYEQRKLEDKIEKVDEEIKELKEEVDDKKEEMMMMMEADQTKDKEKKASSSSTSVIQNSRVFQNSSVIFINDPRKGEEIEEIVREYLDKEKVEHKKEFDDEWLKAREERKKLESKTEEADQTKEILIEIRVVPRNVNVDCRVIKAEK